MAELTEKQIDELASDLRALRQELSSQLADGADACKPVDLDQPIGRLTRMDAIQQQHMARASRRSSERRLAQVAAALSVVEEGEYGFCRRCEEPVGFGRLKARPETPFCLTCQGRSERG